jgi:integrase
MSRIEAQLKTMSIIIGNETLIAQITHSDMMQYRKELLRGEMFYKEGRKQTKKNRS